MLIPKADRKKIHEVIPNRARKKTSESVSLGFRCD